MHNPIIHSDFLLRTDTARTLYHEHAAQMPLFDYHCHLPVKDIALDRQFENLTQLWLEGDHYKWRAMRTLGIPETYITGAATDQEKFMHWAASVPATLRNPLYHWTHLELDRAFGIKELLTTESAQRIYETANELLQSGQYSVRKLIRTFNVHTICTTEDPVDSLHWHSQLADSDFDVHVSTSWRPDKALGTDNPARFSSYVDEVERAANQSVSTYSDFLYALKTRHQYFHDHGCRLADHGLEYSFPVGDYSEPSINKTFERARAGQAVSADDTYQFRSALLHELAVWNWEKGWAQQFHVGALRDVNTKAVRTVGQACGFDSIGDFLYADSMGRFFNRLEEAGKLTRTVIYNLNPRDNEVVASMIGNFQSGSCALSNEKQAGIPGKMQYGTSWWFLDQKDGIQKQLNVLSNLGLLSQFVGMVTDSRSFLSFTRHEYFRRILCDLLGTDIEAGEIPDDPLLVGQLIRDVCFNNAKRYFTH